MIGKVNVKLGQASFQFEIEGEKELEVISKCATLGNPPRRCTLCDSENVVLASRHADSFIFIKVACLDCHAEAALGQYRSGDGYFWKHKFERYEKGAQRE